MRKPSTSPSTRACLHRIDTLRVSTANRAQARAEFERAEAFVETVATMVDAVRRSLSGSAERRVSESEAVRSIGARWSR